MRLPNGYGGVTKLSGRRRKPYMVRKLSAGTLMRKQTKRFRTMWS